MISSWFIITSGAPDSWGQADRVFCPGPRDTIPHVCQKICQK
jgi:hypothetical protein